MYFKNEGKINTFQIKKMEGGSLLQGKKNILKILSEVLHTEGKLC